MTDERTHPDADSAEILSSERSTSDRPREEASSSASDGRAAALDAAPSSKGLTDRIPRELTRKLLDALESDADLSMRREAFDELRDLIFPIFPQADGGAVSRPQPHTDALRVLAAELRAIDENFMERSTYSHDRIVTVADRLDALAV